MKKQTQPSTPDSAVSAGTPDRPAFPDRVRHLLADCPVHDVLHSLNPLSEQPLASEGLRASNTYLCALFSEMLRNLPANVRQSLIAYVTESPTPFSLASFCAGTDSPRFCIEVPLVYAFHVQSRVLEVGFRSVAVNYQACAFIIVCVSCRRWQQC